MNIIDDGSKTVGAVHVKDTISALGYIFQKEEILNERKEIFRLLDSWSEDSTLTRRELVMLILGGADTPRDRAEALRRLALLSAGVIQIFPGKPVKAMREWFTVWDFRPDRNWAALRLVIEDSPGPGDYVTAILYDSETLYEFKIDYYKYKN